MVGRSLMISGFPLYTTVAEVKEFLEDKCGNDTIYAIKLRKSNVISPISVAFAIVQFTDTFNADKIRRVQNMVYYQKIPLEVRDAFYDIVPKPRVSMFELKQTTMLLGSNISEHELSVLCSISDVDVNFAVNLRKISFHFPWKQCSYKLELSYESIWEIQLHKSNVQSKDFLIFLVPGAPKIYKQPLYTSDSVSEAPKNPLLNFFKDIPDDQWIRTTDFTTDSCIGQSSTICLEIPHNCSLPNIGEYFVFFKEFKNPFSKIRGTPCRHGLNQNNSGLNLVPIVHSRIEDIPFKILFKVNSMIQNGTLSWPTINENFFKMVSTCFWPLNFIERALEDLSCSRTCCYNPVKWLNNQYTKYTNSVYPIKSTSITLDSGLVNVHRVQITPCKMYFYGPEINVSNRVLREFSNDLDNFIRISFVDEDSEKMRSVDLAPRGSPQRRTDIYDRILSTLKNGIVIGNKKFDFLAFSSSQLKDNSAWMFASRNGLTASDIRAGMGDFSKIRNVAKYAARLGQCFGSSTKTLEVGKNEFAIIPDVVNAAGYVFSDGIGKISPEFAKRVYLKCNIKSSMPSAFQIRYGGYKGVVAVDPYSTLKLSLRKSMSKFESDNTSLDVLAYSKYQPCYLNRQVITLLSTLGVQDHVFEEKQNAAVDQLNRILTDPIRAEEALDVMYPGETTNLLKEMLHCGYKPDKEPFLSAMLQTFRAIKLLELRTKARMFLPMGRSLMGCLDETRHLEYGQVFVQVSCIGSKQFQDSGLLVFGGSESYNQTAVLKGRIVVAKSPCLHPGDLRILEAVDVPYLHHMVDCVVFPQKGKRPHPNECSGSDLDGDIYFVTWDPDLIPPRQVPPMEYSPAPADTLDHDVLIEEVTVYFANYIVNDSLGVISNAHTVFADKEARKAESEPCLKLAELFSIAVDFSKTGVPAVIPPELQVRNYPDFMEKSDKASYESKGVIGKLFRAVKDLSPSTSHIKAFTREVAVRAFDKDMVVDGFENYVDLACWFKGEYDYKLGNLLDHYGIKTEAEVLGGNIMRLSKSFNKYSDGEALGLAMRSLRKEVRSWFKESSEGQEGGEAEDDLDAKASACYYVTYHPDFWGIYCNVEGDSHGSKRPHFLSFPWCLYDRLIQIKTSKAIAARRARFDALNDRIQGGFRLK